jgi:hypothetical protein
MRTFKPDPAWLRSFFLVFVFFPTVLTAVSLLKGTFSQIYPLLIFLFALIALLWVAFAHGTYLTIDNGTLSGTVFFCRTRSTPILSIVSIRSTPIFGGIMHQITMQIHALDAHPTTRGVTTVEALSRETLSQLLLTLTSINPKIALDAQVHNFIRQ